MSSLQTQSDVWRNRTQSLLDALGYFFTDDYVMWEAGCETQLNCNLDQQSFKAFLTRWMAASTKVAPWTYPFIMSRLNPSAVAAAQSCVGGTSGTICGTRWWDPRGWDGTTGVGQELAALEALMSPLITQVHAPLTNTTGGTSVGNAATAGTNGDDDLASKFGLFHITQKDRAGAGVLTALVLGTFLGGGVWAMC